MPKTKLDELTYGYVPFVGKQRNDDGTITVFGRVADDGLDMDLQRLNADWLKNELPTWFATGANIREQHQQIAAGVGVELDQVDEATWNLKAVIVDPVTVQKTEMGVLNGFSVGIRHGKIAKSARSPMGEIVGGKVVEVSVVDRGSNPTCTFEIAKSAGADDSEWTLSPTPQSVVMDLVRKAATATQFKADEAAPLKTALDAICELIQAEASELPDDLGEIYDIETLLCALRSLREFWWSEAASGEVPEPSPEYGTDVLESDEDMIELSAVADLVKAATADDATDEQKAELTELKKALGIDAAVDPEIYISKAEHDEIVKSAVTESTKDLVERLEKVEKAAAPSGPVVTRTQEDARRADSVEDHISKAATYDAQADVLEDRDAQASYRALARSHRESAERLSNR